MQRSRHVPSRRNDQAASAFSHFTRKTNDKWTQLIKEEKGSRVDKKCRGYIGFVFIETVIWPHCHLWHIEIILGNNRGNPSQLELEDFEYLPSGSSSIFVLMCPLMCPFFPHLKQGMSLSRCLSCFLLLDSSFVSVYFYKSIHSRYCKKISFYHIKDLLYYFTTSFYNISFIKCFIIQFYTLK